MTIRVLLSLLVLTAAAHAQTAPETQRSFFPDVPANHWAFAAVQKLAGAGIVQGFPIGVTPPTVAAKPPGIATYSPEQMAMLGRAAEVTPRVKTALSANAGLKGTFINVDTEVLKSTVTLRGTVKTQAQKQMAFAVAIKNAPGYKVVNQLRISR